MSDNFSLLVTIKFNELGTSRFSLYSNSDLFFNQVYSKDLFETKEGLLL
jgi:hypothetical protein